MNWNKPKSLNVGQFTDIKLYYEALRIGLNNKILDINILEKQLPERIKGLLLIQSFKKTTFKDLIRELYQFNLINKKNVYYIVSDEGINLIHLYENNLEEYNLFLLRKMYDWYVIPGWFIDRLWNLNPDGQGQIVIPSPIKSWKPKPKAWEDNAWNSELNNICALTYDIINIRLVDSLPILKEEWLERVENEYKRLGNLKRKKMGGKIQKIINHFSVRKRLNLAMKYVTIKKLFGNEINGKRDFNFNREPVNTRTFMVWCSRLEYFGLLFYSDFFEDIPGRLVFPLSTFKNKINDTSYKYIDFIKNNNSLILRIHSPKWQEFRLIFLTTLFDVYQRFYSKEGIIYASLQNIRDEVCRLLRISSTNFEVFLSNAFEESIIGKNDYAISLETDIRNDQKQAFQVSRRGVFLKNINHTLIAIKSYDRSI